MRKMMKKWVVGHTVERRRKRGKGRETERKPKRTHHPCRNIS